MVKKITAGAAPAKDQPHSEFTDLATLRKQFGLSYDATMKTLKAAEVKPLHTVPFGKGVMAFYNRKEAFAAIQAEVDARAKAKEEREKKASAKLQSKSGGESSVVDPQAAKKLSDLQDLVTANQDVTSKQFELINIKLDRMDRKQSDLKPDAIGQAVKAALGDSFTALTSVLQRQRAELDKVFAEQKTNDAAQFLAIRNELSALSERMNSMTSVLTSLENTLLAIHTAPSTSVAVESKSGEANKAQDFFRESGEVVAEQVSKATGSQDGARNVPSGSRKNAPGVLKARPASVDSRSASHDNGANTGENRGKPRVLVVGLLEKNERTFKTYAQKLDIEFVDNDKANRLSSQTIVKADYVFLMVKFIGHRVVEMDFGGAEVTRVVGAVSKLRQHLEDICLKHNIV